MYSLILHGRRRSLELHKWRNFTLSLNFMHNASAAALSSRNGQKGQNFTVSYLIDSLGLTTKLAESISKKIRFEEKGNPDLVLNLLRTHKFTDSQISTIITIYPRLLVLDAEKSLGPKLKFLKSIGASSSELTKIVSTVPKILLKERSLRVYYGFIKEVIEADKSSKFEKLSHSLPQGKQENKIRNLSVLRELGVPQKFLFTLLISNRTFVCGKERFEESLKKVIEMGFDLTSSNSKFLNALRIVYTLKSETIEEKVNVYKRLGFTVEDVWTIFMKWPLSLTHSEKKFTQNFEIMKKCGLLEDEVRSVVKKFPQCIGVSEKKIENSVEAFLELGFSRDEFVMMVKRVPSCIGYSVETVKKKTEFVVKQMNWPLKSVVSNPQVLGYSLEKRIVPRCNVIKALLSKGLLGSEFPPMSSVLVSTDNGFLNRYVTRHDDKKLVSELMAIFNREKRKLRVS